MNAPKPRWYKIHLSTAVVMLLAAGVVAGANIRPYRQDVVWHSDNGYVHRMRVQFRGWPMWFAYRCTSMTLMDPLGKPVPFVDNSLPPQKYGPLFRFAANAIVAVGAVLVSGFACERLIRLAATAPADAWYRRRLGL